MRKTINQSSIGVILNLGAIEGPIFGSAKGMRILLDFYPHEFLTIHSFSVYFDTPPQLFHKFLKMTISWSFTCMK